MYDTLEEIQLFAEKPEKPAPLPPDLTDLAARLECYLTRRELSPHRVAHFVAAAYDKIEKGLDPYKRFSEIGVRCLTDEDGAVNGVRVQFFEYSITYLVRVVEDGETARVSLTCDENGTMNELVNAVLRFGEGEWSDDIATAAYRHTYEWLVYILE